MNKIKNRVGLIGVVLLFFIFMMSFALAGQSPTAIDTGVKTGSHNYNQTITNVVDDFGSEAAPSMGDLDGDGDLDMVVGYENGIVKRFRNDNGTWKLTKDDVLGDTGSNAKPHLVDFNENGLLDIIMQSGSQVTFYKNTGSYTSPSFKKVRDFFPDTQNRQGISVADMNNDRDLDMVTTDNNNNKLRYYEQVSNEFSFNFDRDTNKNWLGVTNGYDSCDFLDYDYDGDYDVVCLYGDGDVWIIDNVGNSTNYEWEERGLQEGRVSNINDYIALDYIDYDEDGDYDLFVGNSDGTVDYYEGTYSYDGEPYSFELNNSNILEADAGNNVAPAVADIDDDGDKDIYLFDDDSDDIKFYENQNGSYSYQGKPDGLTGLGTHTRPEFVDIDSDGDYDMITSHGSDSYYSDGGDIRLYENTGNASSPSWTDRGVLHDPGTETGVGLADIDSDGDLDMVSGESGHWPRIYPNEGNSTDHDFDFNFIKSGGGTIHPFEDIYNYASNPIPNFVDWNKDGNVDMLMGLGYGEFHYYVNKGNNSDPVFEYWRSWDDVGRDAAPEIGDLDDDGDYDLLVGDDNGNFDIHYYENVGDEFSRNFTERDSSIYNQSGKSNSIPEMVDWDRDDDLDLITGFSDGTVKYYENQGNNSDYDYSYVRTWMDVDRDAAPEVGDLDNDGDLDLLVGDDNGNFDINYYENVGDEFSRNFTEIDNNIYSDSGSNTIPELIDFDGDGDKDLIVGFDDGTVKYYENQGDANNYDFVYNDTWMNVDRDAAPTMGDLDNDGDYELLVGDDNGNFDINHYENIGTTANPNWNRTTENYISDPGGDRDDNIVPKLVDFDGDGDLDLWVGSQGWDYTYIDYFRNDGSPESADFVHEGNYYQNGIGNDEYPKPSIIDLNNDGKKDLVISLKEQHSRDTQFRVMKNKGTGENPSFVRIMGYLEDYTDGYRYFPDFGDKPAIEFADLNNNGRKDLVGGNSGGEIPFYSNEGLFNTTEKLAKYPSFIHRTNSYISDPGGDRDDNPVPELVDYDGDGDLDLWVGSQGWDYTYIDYFRNDGSPEFADFVHEGNYYRNGIGNDEYPKPSIVDLNNDGKKDLVISLKEQHSRDTQFRVMKNEGSNENPSFVRIMGYLEDYTGGQRYFPDFGDKPAIEFLDFNNDSQFDLIGGNSGGEIPFYSNEGLFNTTEKLAKYPSFIHRTDNYISDPGGDRDDNPVPELVDYDGDGDLDLWVGSQGWDYTYIDYFRNDGSPEFADFVHEGNYYRNGIGNDEYPKPHIMDVNEDGKKDLVMSLKEEHSRKEGVYYFKNVGSNQNPSFDKVTGGENGDVSMSYLPSGRSIEFYDFDNDSNDEAYRCFSNGYCYMTDNQGIYSSSEKRALYSNWIKKTENLLGQSVDNGGAMPALGDLDGDGDNDLVVTSYGDGWDSGDSKIYSFENIGSLSNPSWSSQGTIDSNLGSNDRDVFTPSLVDFDNDRDLDLFVGGDDGKVDYYENIGTYNKDSSVTIFDSNHNPYTGADVILSNSTGVVCDNLTTDGNGQVTCDLNLEKSGTLEVRNAPSHGYVQIHISSPDSLASSRALLEFKTTDFEVDLKKFAFNAAGPKNSIGDGIHIKMEDESGVLRGHTNSQGYLDGFVPEEYITNKMEKFAQNRITYDLDVFPSENYGAHLNLDDIYAPNAVNLSSTTDAERMFKFPSAKYQATDAQYNHFLVLPVINAQTDFEFIERINDSFSMTSPVEVTIAEGTSDVEKCEIDTNGSTFMINDTECSALGKELRTDREGGWIYFNYQLESPGLDTFLNNGWQTRNYTFPPADVSLKS